jgi:hypothetical protein
MGNSFIQTLVTAPDSSIFFCFLDILEELGRGKNGIKTD